MLLAEEIRGLVKTILSQDDLLSFERVLEAAPEVYDYSGVMTDGYNAYNFLDGTLSVDHLLCMAHPLKYFDHFKEGLFMYRKDGRYLIDNNLAERQVRPFTALRKAIQHYGSDGVRK